MTHELYKTKEDIQSWLNQYDIENYELIEDKDYGYIVNINGNVFLYKKNLKEIKVKFNIIKGFFDCNYNKLITLKGSPKEINGNFYCNHNKLKILEGCPEIIKGSFLLSYNNINTLDHFPQKIYNKCHLENNPELGEIQNINDFQELKKIHESIVLNKKLEQEISIDNEIKNVKIKL